jgi:hypothetical protein
MGQMLIILPLGILPIVFFVGWILLSKGSDLSEKHINHKIRKGKTEYPLEASMFWIQGQTDAIGFTEDGSKITFTVTPFTGDQHYFKSKEGVKQWITFWAENFEQHKGSDEPKVSKWADHLIVVNSRPTQDGKSHQITLTIDDELANNEEYISSQVQQLGRTHWQNTEGNSSRYLTPYSPPSQKDNYLYREQGRLKVFISRHQCVPNAIGSPKHIRMSKDQIIRNLQNRLWNRYKVRCISIDDNDFYGELVRG